MTASRPGDRSPTCPQGFCVTCWCGTWQASGGGRAGNRSLHLGQRPGASDPQGWNSCCISLPETRFSRSSLNLQRSWVVALRPLRSLPLAAKDRTCCHKTACGLLHPLAFIAMTEGRANIHRDLPTYFPAAASPGSAKTRRASHSVCVGLAQNSPPHFPKCSTLSPINFARSSLVFTVSSASFSCFSK
jgi:hypothetical protein